MAHGRDARVSEGDQVLEAGQVMSARVRSTMTEIGRIASVS